jgi:hypothetical protein
MRTLGDRPYRTAPEVKTEEPVVNEPTPVEEATESNNFDESVVIN